MAQEVMIRLAALMMLSSCRCGSVETVVMMDHQTDEAGPTVELPTAVQAPIPKLDQLITDEASVERNVIQLKEMGLGRLIDAGPIP